MDAFVHKKSRQQMLTALYHYFTFTFFWLQVFLQLLFSL